MTFGSVSLASKICSIFFVRLFLYCVAGKLIMMCDSLCMCLRACACVCLRQSKYYYPNEHWRLTFHKARKRKLKQIFSVKLIQI